MDKNRLSDYFTLIKHQFALQEKLLEYHFKIDSLVELVLARDLFTYPISKLHDCLLIICDLNSSARKLNEEVMNALIKINALLINPQVSPFGKH